jgi:hypothetical protein
MQEMLQDPLVLAFVRTAAIVVALSGLIVLLRRVRSTPTPQQHVRTLSSMVGVAVVTLSLYSLAVGRLEILAGGLAVGVLGSLALTFYLPG